MTNSLTQEPEYKKAKALLDDGRLSDASALLQAQLQKQPDGVAYQMLLGVVKFRLQHFNEAEELFRQVVVSQPNHYKGVYYLGLSLERQNRNHEALEAFKETNRLQPDFAKAKEKLRGYGISATPENDLYPSSDEPPFSDFTVPRTDKELEDFIKRKRAKERREWWVRNWESKPLFVKVYTVFFFFLFCAVVVGVASVFVFLLTGFRYYEQELPESSMNLRQSQEGISETTK